MGIDTGAKRLASTRTNRGMLIPDATIGVRDRAAILGRYLSALASVDMVVEVQLSNLAADADAECGVNYRHTDANNYWRAYVDKGSSEVILEKVVAGVVTEVASPAWTPADAAEMRVIAQEDRHRVWVDRKVVIDTADDEQANAANAGLMSRNTTVVLFGNFAAQRIN
ncbi:MAG: hypothetical protein C0506_15470 [Anaerolinea sp.]|nr:hypothetical protein [Anaerolinea sp.]